VDLGTFATRIDSGARMGRTKALLGILFLAAWAGAQGGQVCNLAFQACPKTLEGSTIDVPEDVIWLEPKLPFCNEQVQVQTGGTPAPPPSIVFIIDNSGSMDNTDPNEERFKVTLRMLDSIYKVQPATKVGLVVFNRRLVFDHRENPFFQTAFPGDAVQHDSYVPLTALNATVGGRSGIDTLKALLAYTPSGDLVNVTKLPAVRVSPNADLNRNPTNTRDGTDITLGFDAAKLAMSGDANAKENQYFIFLSDGEPSQVDTARQSRILDWRDGKGVPTTFTVYFTANRNPPADLTTMNTNIRGNGYSTGNGRSNLWAMDARTDDILTLLSTSVLNPIFANKPATPTSATLVSGGKTLASSGMDAGNFLFPDKVPLAPNQTTVALTYNYTYTDSGKTKTHVATFNVNIRRVAGGKPPAGVTTLCREEAAITLFHEGKPINLVTADHADLEVRLTLPSGETCTDCTVKVEPHANRAGKDNQVVPVSPQGGYYRGTFGRETSNTPVAGDGKLQHLPGDSIVITWVNPQNPLDVVRKAFPYSDVSTSLKVINHNVYSQVDNSLPLSDRKQWVLVGPPAVKITPDGPADCCKLVPALTPKDSTRYVGIKVTASRSFRVDIKVYDNIGQFVNKLAFTVPQAEFANLEKEPAGGNRSLRVLWDNRTEDGAFAGTGAYVFKTTVTLLRIPGVAEDQVERTDHRLVGVVRDR
jgi:hypothetical protein